MTPEGRIKRKITAALKERPGLWYFMPVPHGYGRSTVDYHCCYRRRFFVIEAKRPFKDVTDRQAGELDDVRAAGGEVFVVNDDVSLHLLNVWLDSIELD